MATGTHCELIVIPDEFECRRHVLIRQRPVAVEIVEIVLTVLKKDSERLWVSLSNERGIDMAAPDVREAADVTDYLAEGIGPLPCDGEGGDAPGAVSANGPAIGVVAQLHGFPDFGNNLLDEKTGVLVAERVVFEAAIFSGALAFFRGRHDPWIDENTHGYRDIA